jgi:hypothetical protein
MPDPTRQPAIKKLKINQVRAGSDAALFITAATNCSNFWV